MARDLLEPHLHLMTTTRSSLRPHIRVARAVIAAPRGHVATLALLAVWLLSVPVAAQGNAATPLLTPQEAEAHDMSLTLAVGCSPRRHNSVAGSESIIERTGEPLVGTAAFYSSFEGTFLVLEEYDEDLNGHCLVFGWFGGALTAGSYPIRQLSQGTIEAELEARDHSFFSMSAVRNQDENSIFVTESGTLEIVSIEAGSMTGSFDLSGFLVDGATRTDDVAWRGSFSALGGA